MSRTDDDRVTDALNQWTNRATEAEYVTRQQAEQNRALRAERDEQERKAKTYRAELDRMLDECNGYGTAALSAQTEACRALSAENEQLRAVVARVTAWRDELARDRGGWDGDIAEWVTDLLDAPAAPKEPTP
jgi:predicted methyltransferase